MDRPLLGEIQARARDYQFTFHAGERMIERHISVAEVEQALLNGEPEVIEDYPEDIRGPSCLILGLAASGRPLHIQCTYPSDVAVVTTYEPDQDEWANLRIRIRGNE